MNEGEVTIRKQEIEAKYDETHNFEPIGEIEDRLRRIVQVISDLKPLPWSELRILDLGCFTGMFTMELAKRGAQVVAIEGREANIEKARFAKEKLELNNVTLIQDDVRNLGVRDYGLFDIVLCLGILYHLDMPDAVCLLENVFEACRSFTIVETCFSLKPEREFIYKDRSYWGSQHDEPSLKKQDKILHAAIGNTKNFRFTRPSLLNVLADVGFSSVYECCNPPLINHRNDWSAFLAWRGRQEVWRQS